MAHSLPWSIPRQQTPQHPMRCSPLQSMDPSSMAQCCQPCLQKLIFPSSIPAPCMPIVSYSSLPDRQQARSQCSWLGWGCVFFSWLPDPSSAPVLFPKSSLLPSLLSSQLHMSSSFCEKSKLNCVRGLHLGATSTPVSQYILCSFVCSTIPFHELILLFVT